MQDDNENSGSGHLKKLDNLSNKVYFVQFVSNFLADFVQKV